MRIEQRNGLRFFRFELFPDTITQGVFTRQGGVSPVPWNSLNVGSMVGDDPERVRENRLRLFDVAGCSPETLHDVWLVHSTNIVFAQTPRAPSQAPVQADILLTDHPGVTLFMRFADCVPILFFDPRKGVVGIAHAGWLGTTRGAASAAVQAMQSRYGCKPEDVLAAIGPSIGPDHYEVGPEVIEKIKDTFHKDTDKVVHARSGRTYLDLWKANELQLNRQGVNSVETAGLCTACHLEDWFSHRAENGKTGRFGALIAL